MDTSKQVHIVGAGLSGLSLAYFLSKQSIPVTVHEKDSAPGGLIKTHRTEHGNVETGANAFMNSALLESVAKDLDVEFVAASKRSKKNRYLEAKNKVSRWPLNLCETLRFLLGLFGIRKKHPLEGESVYDWSARVLGKGAAKHLVSCALRGIYASSAKNLSAKIIIQPLLKKKSIEKPKVKGSVSPKAGMGAFIDALAKNVVQNNGQIIYASEISTIKIQNLLDSGNVVVIASAIWDAAGLVKDLDAGLSQDLSSVPVIPVETTTLFLARAEQRTKRGFGVLFDKDSKYSSKDNLLGVLDSDVIFSGRVNSGDVLAETWISSGSQDPITEIPQKRAALGASGTNMLSFRSILWQKALPLFGSQLESLHRKKSWTKLQDRGIFLHGNYTGPVGVAKILQRSKELGAKIQWRLKNT